MRPLIGITCSRVVGGAWGIYSPGHFMDYLYAEYSRAVLDAGGAPIILPVPQNGASLGAILDRIHGVILTGGPDINPLEYAEEPIQGLGEIDPELDLLELSTARMAFTRDLPIFAICRGIQVLNVCRGGTLYQDIPRQVQDSILHSQKAPKSTLTHTVAIESGSLLYSLLKKKTIQVNSKHHQAVKDVAPGFRISARASDGVVEAMEYPEKPFALGVQWHPEGTYDADPYAKKLFRGFVKAASRR